MAAAYGLRGINLEVALLTELISIWVFPKMVVPPKPAILIRCSIINHPFWGTPIFGNTHMAFTFSSSTNTHEMIFSENFLCFCFGWRLVKYVFFGEGILVVTMLVGDLVCEQFPKCI